MILYTLCVIADNWLLTIDMSFYIHPYSLCCLLSLSALVTGDALPSDMANYRRMGANEIFVKPVDTSILKSHFMKILKNKYNLNE